jgi:hypothetical protein
VPARTAVVHLVRAANGPEPFTRFMAAYERHDPGCAHDLVLVMKGFADHAAERRVLERAAGASPIRVSVPDTGFDLTAYRVAAATLPHRRLCFLNSFSEPQAAGWLALLEEALSGPGVGAAGASGSWGSFLSLNAFHAGLGGEYATAFAARRAVRRTMQEVVGAPSRGALVEWLLAVAQVAVDAGRMRPFPARHLRTNAFIIDRERFLGLRAGALVRKRATYRFEGGRGGMTEQLVARGRPPVVVGRDGVRHAGEWPEADVFWQGTQSGLLVADNQTRAYERATPAQRLALSTFAWGRRARPAAWL